jgi:hypothetical protein
MTIISSKLKCEVIQCNYEKGHRRAAAIFVIDANNIRLWWKLKAAISKCQVSPKKFTGAKKGRFPKTDDVVFIVFQDRHKTAVNCVILFL